MKADGGKEEKNTTKLIIKRVKEELKLYPSNWIIFDKYSRKNNRFVFYSFTKFGRIQDCTCHVELIGFKCVLFTYL